MNVAAIVIGRNEGERLVTCLKSLIGQAAPIIYVDSGSDDGSVDAANALGVTVVALDMSKPFSAARARNEGLRALKDEKVRFVQFVDGDCEVQPGWIDAATAFLTDHSDVAIIAGRLRERFPTATLWNQLADDEWDTPAGEVKAIGGISMARRGALKAVGGFREDLIAGEEPEMCLRLRRAGFRIWRLEDEMALHDAAMTKFSQWWKRATRSGHAYAEGAALHGADLERFRVREVRRILFWGMILPAIIFMGWLIVGPIALLMILLYPLQIFLMSRFMSLQRAFFLTLAKFAEAQGVVTFWIARKLGKRRTLIEYK